MIFHWKIWTFEQRLLKKQKKCQLRRNFCFEYFAVGVAEGFSVTLECFSEAHPTSLNYWTKGDGQMIHDSKKYR